MSTPDDEPGPKRLRQSSILEGFKRLETGSVEEGMSSSQGKRMENEEARWKREMLAQAAEQRQSRQSVSGASHYFQTTSELLPAVRNGSKSKTLNAVKKGSPGFSPKIKTENCKFQRKEDEQASLDSSEDIDMPNYIGSEDATPLSLGTPVTEFRRMPACSAPLTTLKATSDHAILFRPHFRPREPPRPFPDVYKDTWDNDHVRMPCSPENLYPMDDEKGTKRLESRWALIERAFQAPITSSLELEEAITSYNARYANKWDFIGLHKFCTDVLDQNESQVFFSSLLPTMIRLAVDLPRVCTQPPPLLCRGKPYTVTLSQKQIACLLANAFFCTFPRRNTQRRQSEYSTYPDINFNKLFSGGSGGARHRDARRRRSEKLKCLLNYFRRVTQKEPVGSVSFQRESLDTFPDWEKSNSHLRRLHITSEGTIEDDGYGMLQMDFANRFVGGGVLNTGCVQEEIRFIICPELIVSRLFTEVLDENECLIITGCERFSSYTGYADNFIWAGDYEDKTPRDSWGRRCTQVVALDATHFRRSADQYSPRWLKREINKVFCGFYIQGAPPCSLPAVASGNWGCGVFKGDVQLKSLLQLMAASVAGRDMLYFTFHNPELCSEIYHMHQYLKENNVAVGEIWSFLLQYNQSPQGQKTKGIYDFIYKIHAVMNDETTDADSVSSDKLEYHASQGTSVVNKSEKPDYRSPCQSIGTNSKSKADASQREVYTIEDYSDDDHGGDWIEAMKAGWEENAKADQILGNSSKSLSVVVKSETACDLQSHNTLSSNPQGHDTLSSNPQERPSSPDLFSDDEAWMIKLYGLEATTPTSKADQQVHQTATE